MENNKLDSSYRDIFVNILGEDTLNSILDIFGITEDDLFTNEEEEQSKVMLPSEKIDNIEKKMQIHKIIQEYVNEYGISNDDYAKLFEFACWLLNK